MSMPRKGAATRKRVPGDNSKAESFFETLKTEEVRIKSYETFEEAKANLGRFIEDVYNTKRLHSSLRYVPPAEFEAAYAAAEVAGPARELTLPGVR